MQLNEYFQEKRGRQARLARAIGAHASDLCDWASGERPIPIKYGYLIEQETGMAVTRKEMFPDEWEKLWPELAHTDASKKRHRRTTGKK